MQMMGTKGLFDDFIVIDVADGVTKKDNQKISQMQQLYGTLISKQPFSYSGRTFKTSNNENP
jgi:hypothetical protein